MDWQILITNETEITYVKKIDYWNYDELFKNMNTGYHQSACENCPNKGKICHCTLGDLKVTC